MKAARWYGTKDVRVEQVPDPGIVNPRDAVVRVTLSAICGSDLHLYNGYIPTMQKGDVLGHEFMGEVVEVGSAVTSLRPGDRVVVPFTIACGGCFFCRRGLWSLCDNSNPNAWMAEAAYGHSGSGLFGYSHMLGGYAGGQAEYVRVPFADVGPIKVPAEVTDEEALFLSDILPTGFMAAENCDLQPGDTVAVWGCGPVGLLAIRSAFLLGAERVIAIDEIPARLDRARSIGADTLDFAASNGGVVEALRDATFGMGPDACIDAVGLEAHGHSPLAAYDYVKQALRLETDRPFALRQALQVCRKGGTVSCPGVYGGFIDKAPVGAWFGKGLTLKGGQTHVHRYLGPLLERIHRHELDATFVISHRIGLDEVPEAYKTFNAKAEGCVKVVIRPFS